MAGQLGPVPGTTETSPDIGSAIGGGKGVPDPSGTTVNQAELQERMQGVSKLLNRTAASIGEHVKGLEAIATQFPTGSKQLKSAIDGLEKAQQAVVTAITDIVRESQQSDQPRNAPPVIR